MEKRAEINCTNLKITENKRNCTIQQPHELDLLSRWSIMLSGM
jgi:hypothetical protein